MSLEEIQYFWTVIWINATLLQMMYPVPTSVLKSERSKLVHVDLGMSRTRSLVAQYCIYSVGDAPSRVVDSG